MANRTVGTVDRETETAVHGNLNAPYRLGLEDGREGAPHDPPAGWASRLYAEGYARGFDEWLASR